MRMSVFRKVVSSVGGESTEATKFHAGHEVETEHTSEDATTKIRAARTVERMPVTVTLNCGGTSGLVISLDSYSVGDKFGTLPDPPDAVIPSEHKFKGWADSDGNLVTEKTTVSVKTVALVAEYVAGTRIYLTTSQGTLPKESFLAYDGYALGAIGDIEDSGDEFFGWLINGGNNTGDYVTADTIYDGSYTQLDAAFGNFATEVRVSTTATYRKLGICSTVANNSDEWTVVQWGDGARSYVKGNISQLVHEYSETGTFSVYVSDTIKSIGFNNSTSTTFVQTTSHNRYIIKSVVSGVTSLPSYAFSYLCAMTFVSLAQLSSLPSYCFYYCSTLTDFSIPSGVTSIPMYCFYRCTSLPAPTIPDGVTTLGASAFGYCYSSAFKKVVIPDTVTSMGNSCFMYCYYLSDVTLSKNCTTINPSCFYYCFFYSASTGTITIPEGITTISTSAFRYCAYLTAIDIPSTVTSLGIYALAGCTRLATITVRNTTVPTFNSYVFGSTASASSYNGYTGYVNRAAATNRFLVPSSSVDAYTTSLASNHTELTDTSKCGFTIEAIAGENPYDAQVSYLETTGTQCFSIGEIPTTVDKIEVTFAPLAVQDASEYTGYGYTGMPRHAAQDGRAWVGIYATTENGFSGLFAVNGDRSSVGFNAESSYEGLKCKVTFDKTNSLVTVSANSEESKTLAMTFATDESCEWYIGAVEAATYGKMLATRIYGARLYSGDTLVADIIPVRTGTEGWLYDTVSETEYHSQGTGDCSLGDDV